MRVKFVSVLLLVSAFGFSQNKPMTPAQPSPATAKAEVKAEVKVVKPLTSEEKFKLRTVERNLENSKRNWTDANNKLREDQRVFEEVVGVISQDRGLKAEEIVICDGPDNPPCQTTKPGDFGIFEKEKPKAAEKK